MLSAIRIKKAAIFCCQVAAWVPIMLCDFYLMKNDKAASNATTTEAREKNEKISGILRISEIF